MENLQLVKSKLIIDSIPDYVFPGFIEKDKTWNGWDCPWFTKETAESILDTFKYDWSYDEKTDSFKYVTPDGDFAETIVKGEDILVDSTLEHLYPIGNCEWIWVEYLDFQQKNIAREATKD